MIYRARFCTLTIILWCVIFCSCSGQKKDKYVDTVLQCFKTNNEQKLYEISYHINEGSNGIANDAYRKQYVRVVSGLIAKYGIPPKNKWYVKQGPARTYSLNIPIFSGKDTTSRLLESILVLQFPPPNVSYKVFDFSLNNKYELNDEPILAPPLIKKN